MLAFLVLCLLFEEKSQFFPGLVDLVNCPACAIMFCNSWSVSNDLDSKLVNVD